MASTHITVRISIAWWLWLYLSGVQFVAMLTGLEPDEQKVRAAISKAVRVRL